jgi:hypothetical protein
MADDQDIPPGESSPQAEPNPGDPPKQSEAIKRAVRKITEKGPSEISMELTTMMGSVGMMGNPLHQKMNESHIKQMLDLSTQHDTHEYELLKGQQKIESDQQTIDSKNANEQRYYNTIYFMAFILFLMFILWTFRNQPTVLAPIVSGAGGAVIGFIGGMGWGKSHQSDTKSD